MVGVGEGGPLEYINANVKVQHTDYRTVWDIIIRVASKNDELLTINLQIESERNLILKVSSVCCKRVVVWAICIPKNIGPFLYSKRKFRLIYLYTEELTHYKMINLTSSDYPIKQLCNIHRCPLFCLVCTLL